MKATPRLQMNGVRAVVLLTLVAAIGFAMGQDERGPAAPLRFKEFPLPPQQNQPWTPPESIRPKTLVTATSALFQIGLADPRGCDYRAIKVDTNANGSGAAAVIESHGFVLPASAEDKQRFAVCWNGLVYPVVFIGERADLKRDIKAAIKADEEKRTANKDPFFGYRYLWHEPISPSHVQLFPLQVCLLLRLGEEQLAAAVWTAWIAGMDPNRPDDAVNLADPYLMLATDWVWYRFDRAIRAHMRGDDQLALHDARALAKMQSAVEAEADKRGFTRREGSNNGQAVPLPHIDFLNQLSVFLADQERRAGAEKHLTLLADATKEQRIAALIHNLENVTASDGEGGGFWQFGVQATVEGLIKAGEPAVEALIQCLGQDERLTRTVGFGRNFSRRRLIAGVDEPAYIALSTVLQTSFRGVATISEDGTTRQNLDRKDLAATIRAYWEKFKDVPLEERWYQTLADDKAPQRHWLDVAYDITRGVKKGGKSELRGEMLRGKKEPSVTDLVLKRIESMRQPGPQGSVHMFSIGDSCAMAYHLAAWDPNAAMPVLAKLVTVCRDYIAADNPNGSATDTLGWPIANLTQLRVQLGDVNALDEYAAWIRVVDPKSIRHSWRHQLEPMWHNPDHPAIAAAAAAMFGDEKSPWFEKFLRANNTTDLFNSPMVGLVPFRDRLLRELKDTSPAGRFKVNENGSYAWDLPEGFAIHGPGNTDSVDPYRPKPGTTVKFRVCDNYAWGLSALEGAPRFELYWPVADRNRAIAACELFLIRFGDRIKDLAAVRSFPSGRYGNQAEMTFTRLDHPATALEAHKGLAIFAMPSEDKVRQYKLPALPMKAKWVTLKDFPYTAQSYDPKLKQYHTTTEFDQQGVVWQAEEVFKNGTWQRYYGFVGRHIMAKVPAGEIEFPDYDWWQLSKGIDCWQSNPGLTCGDDGLTSIAALGVGDPLPVRVKFRSRLGLEQKVPAEFLRQNQAAGLGLHVGIRLRVRYSAAKDAKTWYSALPTRNEATDWQELRAKSNAHFDPGPAAKSALPGEEFAEFKINLNDWFDMTRPGCYRVQLLFTSADGGFTDGETQEVQFVLAEKSPGKQR